MDRRTFLAGSGAAAIAWAARGVRAQSPRDDRLPRAAAVIEAYDAQGIHRTGTAVDNLSAAWLRNEATRAGAVTELQPFELSRVDVHKAQVSVRGRVIEGLPFFDATFTSDQPLTGRLGAPDSQADFALVSLDSAAISREGQSIGQLRRDGRHRAIVALTAGTTPGLSPSNAVAFAEPYGVPVLQVGSEHQDILNQAAAGGEPVTIVVYATRTSAHAQNVIATVRGREPDLPPLVVMTPRSGWWHCASERGGGIVCWLEIMRALATARAARTTLFVASSGHELGHYGLDAFLDSRKALIKDAAAWIHLGANIGAAGGRTRLQTSDDAIERLALEALASTDARVEQRVPRGTVPGGEARNIHVGGGRYVSLLGSSPLFHNIADRWPAAVDLPAVAGYSAAMSTLALRLARGPADH